MSDRRHSSIPMVRGLVLIGSSFLFCPPVSADKTLFPLDLPGSQWNEFQADGFSDPVCGVVYRQKDHLDCGMALGAIDTGCIDLETNGFLGYMTIFNSLVPRRGPLYAPFLGMNVGGKTWVLCTPRKQSFLPKITAWWPTYLGANQPAWSRSADTASGWARSTGLSPYDLPAGKIFCHSPAVVRWISPVTGEIEIGGGLWLVRNWNRVQKWELRKNGKTFTEGKISWGPTSSDPQGYGTGTGTGGPGVLRQFVRAGDPIELVLQIGEPYGDHVGVDLEFSLAGTERKWDLAADWSETQNPNGAWVYDDKVQSPHTSLLRSQNESISHAKEIHYWGHYPVVDLEFETDAPVQVGVRAWSSFIPGSLVDSLIPGAVFEIRLRNPGELEQKGSIAFSFPGPTSVEAGGTVFERRHIGGSFNGLDVKGAQVAYALGVVGEEKVRVGGELGYDATAWKRFATDLPNPSESDPGSTVVVDFSLHPGGNKVIRFVLAWCAPIWSGGGSPSATGRNVFTHMYAKHYPDPVATAQRLAETQKSLLNRILAWQQVIYSEPDIPLWLKDGLINNLYLITETGLWARINPPLGDWWLRPEDGLWGMIESPRACPQIECIPCSLYGNIPIVYFFPELALSTLRGYRAFQRYDGRPAWTFGRVTEMASPDYNDYQSASNGVCIVEMIDKMWLRTGDDAILKEFYEMAKKVTYYSMNLAPEFGDKQVISMPTDRAATEWFEEVKYDGMASHIGGLHLAQLLMVKRMAEKMGDLPFARQCEEWFQLGAQLMEDELWKGNHYLLFKNPFTGHQDDTLMAWLLDGEWILRFHGMRGAFQEARAHTTLETIARANANPAIAPLGTLVFSRPEGEYAGGDNLGYWGNRGTHTPSCFMLGMTYMYFGKQDFGLDLIHRVIDCMFLKRGYTWDWPIVYNVENGERIFGADYYQNLMLWSVPAVLKGQDLTGPCKDDGLVARMIQSGKG